MLSSDKINCENEDQVANMYFSGSLGKNTICTHTLTLYILYLFYYDSVLELLQKLDS